MNSSRRRGVTAGFGPSSNVSAIDLVEAVCRTVGPNNSDEGPTAPQVPIPAAVITPADTKMGKEFNSFPMPLIFARPRPAFQPVCFWAVRHFPKIPVYRELEIIQDNFGGIGQWGRKRGTRQTHKRLSLQLNQNFRYLTGSPPSRQGCRLDDYKTLFCCGQICVRERNRLLRNWPSVPG